MINYKLKEKFILGTAQFGLNYGISNSNGKTDNSNLEKIINFLHSNKIRCVDTAPVYGNAEERIGKFNLDSWKVISKYKHVLSKNQRRDLKSEVNKTITHLSIPRLHGLLFHDVNDLLGTNGLELYEQSIELKEKRIINKIGISIYDDENLDELLNKYKMDIIQCPINIIDQRLLKSKTLKYLKELDIEIHARSVFLQGLLLASSRIDKIKNNKLKLLHNNWCKWLKNYKTNPIDACISFVLGVKEVDKIIFGVNNFEQLNEILRFQKIELPLISNDLIITDKEILQPNLWN